MANRVETGRDRIKMTVRAVMFIMIAAVVITLFAGTAPVFADDQEEPSHIVYYTQGDNTLYLSGIPREGYKALSEDGQKNYNRSRWNMEQWYFEKVVVQDRICPRSMYGWFIDHTELKTLEGLENIDTSYMSSLDGFKGLYKTFQGCTGLEYVDLGKMKLTGVEDIGYLFDGCTNLKSVNLEGIDTSSLKNMFEAFGDCSSLESIALNKFDTSNVTNMSQMFYRCKALKTVDLDGIDTGKVTTFLSMFYGCESLTGLDLTKFDTSSATSVASMFSGCTGLIEADISTWDISNIIEADHLFTDCENLKTIYAKCDMDWTGLMDSMHPFCGRSNTGNGCLKLVGGNGTTWNYDRRGFDYARIDGLDGREGLLTAKHEYDVSVTQATLEKDGEIQKTCRKCGFEEKTVISRPADFALSGKSFAYDGSQKKPAVTVRDAAGEVIPASNYDVTYSNNTNIGTASVSIAFKGEFYSGTKRLTFTIDKAKNPMTVKAKKTVTVKYAKLKKKNQTVKIAKALTVANAQGTVTYKLKNVTKKKFKKYFKVAAKTGKITIKKKLKKGTYKIAIDVTCAGDPIYNPLKKTVNFKLKVE